VFSHRAPPVTACLENRLPSRRTGSPAPAPHWSRPQMAYLTVSDAGVREAMRAVSDYRTRLRGGCRFEKRRPDSEEMRWDPVAGGPARTLDAVAPLGLATGARHTRSTRRRPPSKSEVSGCVVDEQAHAAGGVAKGDQDFPRKFDAQRSAIGDDFVGQRGGQPALAEHVFAHGRTRTDAAQPLVQEVARDCRHVSYRRTRVLRCGLGVSSLNA
jgi:hypothetical protein